jgi:hypothetical protein
LPRGVRQQLGDAVLAGHRHHGTDPAAGHGQPLPRPVCRRVLWPVAHDFIFPPPARCPAPASTYSRGVERGPRYACLPGNGPAGAPPVHRGRRGAPD